MNVCKLYPRLAQKSSSKFSQAQSASWKFVMFSVAKRERERWGLLPEPETRSEGLWESRSRIQAHDQILQSALWHGYRSFRYKLVSIKIYSVDLWIVSRTWQNVFLVYAQAFLEVTEIFVQFHCLSLYQNDRFPLTVINVLSYLGSITVLRWRTWCQTVSAVWYLSWIFITAVMLCLCRPCDLFLSLPG